MKRVFLIVLDSVGIGEMPDSGDYGDFGSNTLRSCFSTNMLNMPNIRKLGFFNIDGIDYCEKEAFPMGSFARMTEKSKGKDTTVGHWEIAGLVSEKPFPTYPSGFPDKIIENFKEKTGKNILCNKPYSGTEILKDFAEEHIKTGDLIVYTSADSVFQIAAHEKILPVSKLYEICKAARDLLTGEHAVARVIARPFEGDSPNFKRTENRRDFSLVPPKPTMLDFVKNSGLEVISVGKICDIFSGKGITLSEKTHGNEEGLEKTLKIMNKNFNGLCFVNLVDFDMLYGHRNDVAGYTKALNYFDGKLGEIIKNLKNEDILIITADHGCDPLTPSTDHSREYVPMVIFGEAIKSGINLGTRESFSDVSATILEYLGVKSEKLSGESFLKNLIIKPKRYR